MKYLYLTILTVLVALIFRMRTRPAMFLKVMERVGELAICILVIGIIVLIFT